MVDIEDEILRIDIEMLEDVLTAIDPKDWYYASIKGVRDDLMNMRRNRKCTENF